MRITSQIIISLSLFISIKAIPFNDSYNAIFPPLNTCGYQADFSTKPNEINIKEFPWVVYIPLEPRSYNPQANLRCAGVLISKRYVIFNKSCLQFVLTKVQLGRFDTSQNVTCVENICTDAVVEVQVESKVVDDSMDAVLLRLEKDVEFTDYIKPICLPWDNFQRATIGSTLFTSGWGLKNIDEGFSTTKKKVQTELLNNDDCPKNNIFINTKEDNRLCLQRNKDSASKACNGDEGSPIMYNSNGQWVLEGVLVSVFDSIEKPCSLGLPSFGFKITDDVLQWIVQNVRE